MHKFSIGKRVEYEVRIRVNGGEIDYTYKASGVVSDHIPAIDGEPLYRISIDENSAFILGYADSQVREKKLKSVRTIEEELLDWISASP